MKVLQINTTANSGSHGRIAEEIGRLLIEQGHESFIAYGRTSNNSRSELIKIGSRVDHAMHLVRTRIFDLHGFGSINATELLISKVKELNPDIIHLHNLHGYYLNIEVLFKYLRVFNKPVIWTFHDCWPFTGHCCFFDADSCPKWQIGCFDCPSTHNYPKSWMIDNSRMNYRRKKEIFMGVKNMVLVSPSEWLAGHLRNSFLSSYDIRVINNGVDLQKFRPVDSEEIRTKYGLKKNYVLGVASIWSNRKGLSDFISLRKILEPEIEIVMVGLTKSQAKQLPSGMKSVSRTENTDELAAIYSGAKVFINPTHIDNFPSVNIEALACGTPVITYNTGGSPESVGIETGIVVEKSNIKELHNSIRLVINSKELYNPARCHDQALMKFSASERFGDYLNLYNKRLFLT